MLGKRPYFGGGDEGAGEGWAGLPELAPMRVVNGIRCND